MCVYVCGYCIALRMCLKCRYFRTYSLLSPGCPEANQTQTLRNIPQALVSEEYVSMGFILALIEVVVSGSHYYYVLNLKRFPHHE